MILDFSKWKKLNEQQAADPASTNPTEPKPIIKTWTNDPESMEIMKIFNSEFIPSLLGNVDELTLAEYGQKLATLTTDQFDKAIQFFKNKGYAQPNDKIKKFQEDLMNNSDYKTFTTTEDKTKPFNDGIFGRATASALVRFSIQKLKRTTDQTMKVKDTKGRASGGGNTQPAAKVGTTGDVKTGTGTQTLK